VSWLDDTRLRDLGDKHIVEAMCLKCGFSWRQTPVELLLKVDHRDVKMSKVAKELACRKYKCKHVGVRLAILRNHETCGFVGGMP